MDYALDDDELALRFGRCCREIFADEPWEAVEQLIRRTWTELVQAGPWEHARPLIEAGWRDAAPATVDPPSSTPDR